MSPDKAAGSPHTEAENLERLRLQLQKLALEVEGLRLDQVRTTAETLKLQGETRKIEHELGGTRFGRLLRAAGSNVAPWATVLAVLVSGLAVFASWRSEAEKRNLEEFHRIVTEFAAPAPTARAGAAVLLSWIAATDRDASRRSQAKTLLLAAIGAERELNVYHAIEEALVGLGTAGLDDLKRRQRDVERELRIAFGVGAKPTCEAFGADQLARLRGMQEGLLILARVRARVEKRPLNLQNARFRCALLMDIDAKGAQFQDAVLWQADLSRATLVDADFTNAQLDDANLFEADISGAKFCGPRLTGLAVATIREAHGWQSAHFPRDFAGTLTSQAGASPRICP